MATLSLVPRKLLEALVLELPALDHAPLAAETVFQLSTPVPSLVRTVLALPCAVGSVKLYEVEVAPELNVTVLLLLLFENRSDPFVVLALPVRIVPFTSSLYDGEEFPIPT